MNNVERVKEGEAAEVEKVTRLEKKVRELESVKAGAVARVCALEGERRELRGKLVDQQTRLQEQDARRQDQEAKMKEQEALMEKQEARRQELVARTELQDTTVTMLQQQVSPHCLTP